MCCTWNIRRGLITREKELKEILNKESIDIAFITETDTTLLAKEENYLITGYKTIFPNRVNDNSKKIYFY